MREVVEKRLRGQFEYESGSLTFSEHRLELTIDEGSDAEGSFIVYGPKDRIVEGTVSATELRMSVLTTTFSGAQDTISYHFHGEGLKGGDVLQGYFRIVSNQGEYQVPFVVSVQIHHIDSEVGDIRNLFHFANLARTNFNAAVRLFYDPRFAGIFDGNDARYAELYRGLSVSPGNTQNVEEFLLAVNKKQQTAFLPDRREIDLPAPVTDQEFIIHISRNGWGYTYLKVEADAPFIKLSQHTITEEDFLGNSVSFRFTVRTEALHAGRNIGRLTFRNAFTSFAVDVSVNKPSLPAQERDLQHDQHQLFRLYEAFRLKQINMDAWMSRTEQVLKRMNALMPEDLAVRLYRAHFALTAERDNEAKWILGQAKSQVEESGDERMLCYFRYLLVLADEPGVTVDDTVVKIKEALLRSPHDWRLNWLLLYLSDEYTVSLSKKRHLLQELYTAGCRSPFIYIEALQMMNTQPGALNQLDYFALDVLRYGVRHDALSAGLREQILNLAVREKTASKDLFEILTALYEKDHAEAALLAVCETLIRAGRTDEAAFPFYAAAVERSLRITRLYEYYMLSAPMSGKGAERVDIPKEVLMYYSYQSSLPYDKAAALYRYVLENKGDYPELYESYLPQIHAFLKEQISKRHINEDLSVLYKNFLTRDMVDADNAHAVLQMLYTARIKTEDPRAVCVIVRYHHLEKEREYPVIGGEAYVPLFGSEYTVLLLDKEDNRYAVSIPHENVKLILPGQMITYAMPYLTDGEARIDLFLTEQSGGTLRIEEESLHRYQALAEDKALTDEARAQIRLALLRYYYDRDYLEELSALLEQIRPERLTTSARGDVIDMMILAGMYEKALSWLKSYGTFEIDARSVVRLYSRMMDREILPGGEDITEIAFYAFRKGKYDERLLRYLTNHFHGMVKEMRDIWKASAGFSVDTYRICERILVQMLYSGSYIGDRMHVFRDYVNRTGNAEIESAFLSQCAYDSFVKDRVMEEYIFERIARQHMEGVHLDKICKLAYLKHYAENKKSGVTPDVEVVRDFLMHLTREKMLFPFYQDYIDALPQMVTYADKTIMEYRTRPGNRCIMHYQYAGEMEDTYQSVQMTEQYDGVYVTSFTLFFGEQMQYYITESSGGKEEVTESGLLTKNDIAQTHGAGRFNLINDIMIGEALHDYETVDRLLEEYYRKQFIVSKLFRPFKTDGSDQTEKEQA